jgi:hypothetical protein
VARVHEHGHLIVEREAAGGAHRPAAAAAEEAAAPITVGDTPWGVIAALAALSLLTGAALALWIRARLVRSQ